jgi:hypothetical protein
MNTLETTSPALRSWPPELVYPVIIVLALLVLVVVWVWIRGRRLPGGHVFQASRLSRGNRIFPSQVVVTPQSLTLYTPQWIGKREESIHIAHVASVRIDTNLLFADIYVETTGGQNPIVCHGHKKGDAVRIKALIEQFQTQHYRKDTGAIKSP